MMILSPSTNVTLRSHQELAAQLASVRRELEAGEGDSQAIELKSRRDWMTPVEVGAGRGRRRASQIISTVRSFGSFPKNGMQGFSDDIFVFKNG